MWGETDHPASPFSGAGFMTGLSLGLFLGFVRFFLFVFVFCFFSRNGLYSSVIETYVLFSVPTPEENSAMKWHRCWILPGRVLPDVSGQQRGGPGCQVFNTAHEVLTAVPRAAGLESPLSGAARRLQPAQTPGSADPSEWSSLAYR